VRVRRAARAALIAVAALAASLPLAAAHAADQPVGHIVDAKPTDAGFDFVLTASGLAASVSLDPSSVHVTINGRDVQAKANAVADPTNSTPVDRWAELVIDVSGSMKDNNKLVNAKAAAKQFLSTVPADVKVGLVAFSDPPPKEIIAPTPDRAALITAVDSLQANGSTALYDGVVFALQRVGTTGVRNMVLLSDGKDEGSVGSSLDSAVQQVAASGITLDAVSLGTTEQEGALLALTQAGKGRLLHANDANQLNIAFQSAARTLNNQLIVHAPVPSDLARKAAEVAVSAKAGNDLVTDKGVYPLGGTPAPSPTANPLAPYGPKPVPAASGILLRAGPLLPFAVFIGVGVMLAFAFASAIPAAASSGGIRRRLSVYTLTGTLPVKESEEDSSTTALGSSTVARSAVELAGRVVRKRDFEEVLGTKLEGAGVPLKPAEWLIIHVGTALGLSLLMLLLFSGRLIAAAIGLFAGVMVPWAYLDRKESRRRNAFLAALPDTLQLLAGSLSAGYSLPQAADSVVREGHEPMAGEFNRALIETRLGVPLEDALEGIATRLSSDDFHWVVMAIKIQREVGGNLAELLTTVAATLRERERLRRQVQVLSAEGRLSAWILGLLPVAFASYLILARPQYIRPLYTQPLGWGMIFVGLVLLITGVLWLRRTVRVEV
jgi:tight adherence protein B